MLFNSIYAKFYDPLRTIASTHTFDQAIATYDHVICLMCSANWVGYGIITPLSCDV